MILQAPNPEPKAQQKKSYRRGLNKPNMVLVYIKLKLQ